MSTSNPLFNAEIYGSSTSGGTLTLSGSGPGTPGGNVYINPQGGNTGIGTNNPSNALSVEGNVDFSGNVGIGTNSPTDPLTVSGNTTISGNFSVGGYSTLGLATQSPVSLLVTNNQTGGAGVHWNLTGGGGETDLVNFTPKGTSTAFNFYSVNISQSPPTYTIPNPLPAPLLTINSSGSVCVTTNLINSGTQCNVVNWGQPPLPTFSYTNGTLSSSGGITIGNQSGFAKTQDGGNYGYYVIDLGGICSGFLSLNMVLCKDGSGNGLWNIVSSQQPMGTAQNFQSDSTAMQIWVQFQDISNGQIFSGGNTFTMPVQATVYFNNARSFYIGAVDLGNGEAGIKINSISVTPLALS